MPKWLTNIAFSFPVRLLILHFRSNLLLITLWIFLVLLISGALGRELGFLYLFLEPEYLNEVNFWSFFDDLEPYYLSTMCPLFSFFG